MWRTINAPCHGMESCMASLQLTLPIGQLIEFPFHDLRWVAAMQSLWLSGGVC